ncbi:MAG: hypothetical protein SF182_19385 [Deltaproteobacteria bacterium]|nr:hypothetical protein [Deltaproteobacteria bacterium]
MKPDRYVRALAAEQLGLDETDLHALPLIDLALALAERLGIKPPRYRLRAMQSYADLLRLLRDTLVAAIGDGCYLRARLRSRGVTMIRIGALTPEFTAALAEDLRHAAEGTLVDVVAPDDLSDAQLAGLTERLAWLTGARGRVVVHRAGSELPSVPRADRTTQAGGTFCLARAGHGTPSPAPVRHFEPGIGVAQSRQQRFFNPRRSIP